MSKLTESVKRFFKPISPVEGGRPKDPLSPAAAENYRLDLTLQNLLSIGSEFSPDDIINLRKRARYGDPRWLYSLYDEMMRLGPAPQVLKAREAIKGTDTTWHATPDTADENEETNDPEEQAARLIRDVTEEAWGKWLPDLKTHLSTKYFYGIAAMQVLWSPKAIEGKWSRITDIRPIPARRFRLDPNTLRFKFLADPYSFEGPFVDDLQKSGKLIFVESGADTEPLDQRGLLYQCLIPWAIEQFIVRWRAKRLQNFGMPPVMVEYPANDPQNRAVAEQLADLLASGTRAAVPKGLVATLLSAPGAGSRGGDPYETAIEWCERTYDKIILGHSQVSGVQVGAGSRTSSNDAIGLFKDVTNSRAHELDNDIEQQGLSPYVRREFGTEWAENHTPRLVSAVEERDDPLVLAQVAATLATAGAAGIIGVEDLVERATLKVAEDGETTLAGNVKGETPSPAEVNAYQTANPMQQPQQVGQVGPDGKPLPLPPQQQGGGGQGGPQGPQRLGPDGKPIQPKPGQPGQRPAAGGPPDKLLPGEPGTPTIMPRPEREPIEVPKATKPGPKLKKDLSGKGIRFAGDKRQRFAAAALVGGRPRITLTTFGHEYGPPEGASMILDVRTLNAAREYDTARSGTDSDVRAAIEAHPMTHAIYGGVKSRVTQAIRAGELVGASDMNFCLGCEHGKHRSVYVAERLAGDLRNDGHDVTVMHRDAHTKAGERGIGRVIDAAEKFGEWREEDHPRGQPNNAGQFVEAGGGQAGGKQPEGQPAGGGTEKWETKQGEGWHPKGEKVMEEAPFEGPFPEAKYVWDQPVDEEGRPIAIKVNTVEEAIPLVLEGKVVELPEVRTVNTLINKLADMANEAKAAGKEAINYDLCNVTVAGTNLFCAETLNHERIVMPQLAGTPMPGSEASKIPFTPGTKEVDAGPAFIKFLGEQGYKVTNTSTMAATLKATQNQLVGTTVGGIMRAAETNRTIIDTPIFITKDGYIVDGHHRWAAVVALDAAKNKFQTRMNVHKINAGITEILHLANHWSKKFGIKQKSGATKHEGKKKFAADAERVAGADFRKKQIEARIAARVRAHLQRQKAAALPTEQ